MPTYYCSPARDDYPLLMARMRAKYPSLMVGSSGWNRALAYQLRKLRTR
jgi:hypothetical protein